MSAFIITLIHTAVLAVCYGLCVILLIPVTVGYVIGLRIFASGARSGSFAVLMEEAVDLAKKGASKVCKVVELVL